MRFAQNAWEMHHWMGVLVFRRGEDSYRNLRNNDLHEQLAEYFGKAHPACGEYFGTWGHISADCPEQEDLHVRQSWQKYLLSKKKGEKISYGA